jgi:hypothetical protein
MSKPVAALLSFLSALAPIAAQSAQIPGTGCPAGAPLQLTPSGTPLAGATVTFSTSHLPNGCGFVARASGFGILTPGLELTAAGMPGCLQHVAFDVVRVDAVVGAAVSVPLPIPAGLGGLGFGCQAIGFAPRVNAAGAVTSNGVLLRL